MICYLPEKRKIQVDTLQSLPHFKYKDLILATNNFSQKNVLGNGGFGTVYKGQFDQALVAIKTLNRVCPACAVLTLRTAYLIK